MLYVVKAAMSQVQFCRMGNVLNVSVNCSSIGDHRLSLLLSQAMGSQYCRDLLALQLADWNRMQTDSYVPEERLRIFALLAGKPVRCLIYLKRTELK